MWIPGDGGGGVVHSSGALLPAVLAAIANSNLQLRGFRLEEAFCRKIARKKLTVQCF